MSSRARRFAEKVHQRLGSDSPPANAPLLIVHAPIDVKSMDWPAELAGILVMRRNRAVIGLNRRHSQARRHFSFWHEVGHYLLHRPALRACGLSAASGPSDAGEREADAFAANMLMPEHWVRAFGPGEPDLFRLARRFHVSMGAMARRLAELGLR